LILAASPKENFNGMYELEQLKYKNSPQIFFGRVSDL